MTLVALGLGSNLGDRLANLQNAVDYFADLPETEVVAVSPIVETDPVGGPEQPDYLNAVLIIETAMTAQWVLRVAQEAESQASRVREVRWGPRTLDVDILTFGDEIIEAAELVVPHPRAAERGFVLVPWAAIAPTMLVPDPSNPLRCVADALSQLGPNAADGVRDREDLALSIPKREYP